MFRRILALFIVCMMFSCVASADVFGPRKADKLKGIDLPVEPETVLDGTTDILEYLGSRAGGFYDIEQEEWGSFAGATLYTYEPWKTSLDIGMTNADGVAICAEVNVGAFIPADDVPLLEVVKHAYVGVGYSLRFLDDGDMSGDGKEWQASPVFTYSIKLTI